jgi:hypothetical protein
MEDNTNTYIKETQNSALYNVIKTSLQFCVPRLLQGKPYSAESQGLGSFMGEYDRQNPMWTEQIRGKSDAPSEILEH